MTANTLEALYPIATGPAEPPRGGYSGICGALQQEFDAMDEKPLSAGMATSLYACSVSYGYRETNTILALLHGGNASAGREAK